MRMPAKRRPSLRRRLLTGMLLPAVALALILGGGGALLIRNVVETTHDRLLDGSVLAIAERLTVDEDDEVTVDLPPVALGMLDSQAGDRIYYNVSYNGTFVTGYRDLPLADASRMQPRVIGHRDAEMRGAAVRIAAQIRRIYGKPDPVLVQVAETRNGRRLLEWSLLGGLALLEGVLLSVVGVLAWLSIGRGLRPLTRLSTYIDGTVVRGAVSLNPVPTADVPEEVLALALALNALLERLEQTMGAIQRFTADASHQMRTPLAVLRTHVSLLRREHAITREQGTTLDHIETATRRLGRLLEQLLALARAEDEQDGMDSLRTDLAVIAATVAMEHVPLALARGMTIELERPEEEILIQGKSFLITEVIANLLDNALCYNRDGGTIVVRVIVDAAGPRVEIEDEGPGIPPTERTKVFQRFYRAVQPGGPEGSGLGLAIVRALADQLGAVVSLDERAYGSGLLVTVVFRPARS